MRKTGLIFLLILTLCFCALLCGVSLAEQFTASVADFNQLVPATCERIVLYDRENEYISEEGGSMYFEPTKMIGLRIYPQTNCSVVSVVCNGVDYGVPYSETLRLSRADGEVSTWFTMPYGKVTLEITMSVDGVVQYEASFTGTRCQSVTLTSSGGQTGLGSIRVGVGETITVNVVPLEGYDELSMSYTTRSNPISVPLECTRNEDGSFTTEMVMPEEPLYITAEAGRTPIPYISYDAGGQSQGTQYCTEYDKITNGSAEYYDISDSMGGWYVVQGIVHMSSSTTIRVTGDVHLILCDGAILNANDGIYIKKGSSLSIYGQSSGTGKIVAMPDGGPGIGGMADTVGGSLYIHGGVIEAEGGTNAAGIGGGNHSSGYENIVIYGGTVTAQGGSSGAGLGKGQQNENSDCGPIEIYGGTVNATGGSYGAGIGGGEDRGGGNIAIYGGTVTAEGGHDGAGIGGGEGGNGGSVLIAGGTVTATGGDYGAGIGGGEGGSGATLTIQGGTVRAYSGKEAAGIGGGKTSGNELIGWNYGRGGAIHITGGSVEAHGGEEAAGIGGSRSANAGSFIMDGGAVTAVGGKNGAGIGGGVDGDGGIITINGGTVNVRWDEHGDKTAYALGRGDDDNLREDQLGEVVTLYPGARVNDVPFNKRVKTCKSHTAVTIAPCDHEVFSYHRTESTHTKECHFCETRFEEEPHTYDAEGICTVCGYEFGSPVFGTPDFILPEDVTAVEESAFEGAAMTVVYIPDACESIGDYAFRDCLSLTQIRVPAGCALGQNVFSGCGTVYVFGTAGSPAESYCAVRGNCVFVEE